MEAVKKMGASRSAARVGVGNGVFWIYIYFLIDFFLHFSARIPGYGVVRPTLLLVLIITVSLFANKEKLKGYGSDPVSKSLNVLFIYIIIALPLVEWPGSVLKNNMPEFVKAIVFFFFTSLIIDSERRLRIFLFVFVGCQTIRVLEPLYMHLTQGYWGSATYIGGGEFAGRLSGAPSDIINPNELGFVIATAIPFLHYLLWSGPFRHKALYISLLLPLVYALTLTMSRGALVALFVVGWMIFKQSKAKPLLIMAACVGLVVLWSSLSPLQKDRYLSLVSSDTQSAGTVEGRLDGMWGEFTIGLQRPIVGHGVGTTAEAKFHNGRRAKPSHNLYAELLVEIGAIGFVLFMLYFKNISQKLSELKVLINKVQKPGSKGPPDKESGWLYFNNLTMALTAVFWMYIVYSFNYYGLSVYYWYFFGGLVLATYRIVDKKYALEEIDP